MVKTNSRYVDGRWSFVLTSPMSGCKGVKAGLLNGQFFATTIFIQKYLGSE